MATILFTKSLTTTGITFLLIVIHVMVKCSVVRSVSVQDLNEMKVRSILQTCEDNGVAYNMGEIMPSDVLCDRCVCGEDGSKVCEDKRYFCGSNVRCVDAEIDPTTCCKYCPNGDNCWVEGRIMSADGSISMKTEERDCNKICQCPREFGFFDNYDADTHAECYEVCE